MWLLLAVEQSVRWVGWRVVGRLDWSPARRPETETFQPVNPSFARYLMFYVCICVQSSTRLAVPRECLGGLRPLLWSSIRASSPGRGEAALGIWRSRLVFEHLIGAVLARWWLMKCCCCRGVVPVAAPAAAVGCSLLKGDHNHRQQQPHALLVPVVALVWHRAHGWQPDVRPRRQHHLQRGAQQVGRQAGPSHPPTDHWLAAAAARPRPNLS